MATLAGDFAWSSSAVNQDWLPWFAMASGGKRLATIATDTTQYYAVGFTDGAKQIDTITFDQPHASLYVTEFTVEASTDAIIWTTVHVESGLTSGTNKVIDMSGGFVPFAQYWRIRATALNDTRMELENVRWTEGPGSGLLSMTAPTTVYGMGDPNVVDGDQTITASATAFGGPEFLDDWTDPWRGVVTTTVDYDFGSAIAAKNLLIVGAHASNTLEQFTLYYSDNGSSWTSFYEQTASLSGIYSPPELWWNVNFEDVGAGDPGSHRYWRVEIDGAGGSGAELEYMMFLEGTLNLPYDEGGLPGEGLYTPRVARVVPRNARQPRVQ